jgi:uncharacterized membrane protein YqhA
VGRHWFEHVLAWSRFIVYVPVVFLLADAAAAFAYGSAIFVFTFSGVHVSTRTEVEGILGRFLAVMDAYLVGVTLMIAAFGFYGLFIARTDPASHRYWMPGWLQMHDIEDLKARVVSMLILVAAITFVDVAVQARGGIGVFYLGAGISVVIAALTAFLRFGRGRGGGARSSGEADAALDHQQHADDRERARQHDAAVAAERGVERGEPANGGLGGDQVRH